MPKQIINLTVNGEPRELAVEPHWTLLETVREQLGFTGSKEGCGTGDCGACSMILREPQDDGRLITSCLMLAPQADGCEVTTIEGPSRDERRPAPGAAGVHRRRRRAVRLLHAGHGHGREGAARTATRGPRSRRSGWGWPATSAAAPDTRRSTRRCSPPPRGPARGSAAWHQRDRDTKEELPQRRQARTPHRGPGQGHGQDRLRRRHEAAAHAARQGARQPARPRPHQVDRRREGAPAPRRRRRDHGRRPAALPEEPLEPARRSSSRTTRCCSPASRSRPCWPRTRTSRRRRSP